MFKIGEIRELIRLLDETSVTELSVENGDAKLVIRKSTEVIVGGAPAVVPLSAGQPVLQAPAPAAVEASTAAPAPAPATGQNDTPEAGTHLITSPMVGTFYRSSSPDAAPYVEKGSSVNEKSVVCIVEAMKLMNEIEAEVRGEVVEVLAENGQLVEYGQPLFKIKLA